MNYIICDKVNRSQRADYRPGGPRAHVHALLGKSAAVTDLLDSIDGGAGWGYPADDLGVYVTDPDGKRSDQ